MRSFCLNTFLLLALLPVRSMAQDVPEEVLRISEAALADLQEQAAGLEEMESTVEMRRAAKRIVRGAESLMEEYPESPDRFRVLGIVFNVQKALFAMRQSAEHREALLEAAKKLVEAPDECADVRVEPDMMLLQLELGNRGSSDEDGALALARFADRYRGTSAEAQSLMMAASVAFDRGNVILLNAFRKSLSTRFSDDPLVTAFMRERFASGSQIHLSGEFRRADDKRVSFPLGQIYLACFWSLDTPLLKDRIAEISAVQDRYKGAFKVFSFNLDELADSGAAALQRMGLDWVPMRLPGGVENTTYLSVGGANMYSALVVSAHGLASKDRTGRNAPSLHKTYEALAQSPRHIALLSALCIGDYLVAECQIPGMSKIFRDALRAIQDCFPSPPLRNRLSIDEGLRNYEKAEKLCGEAVAGHSSASDLWLVHNLRTIALLGLWRNSGELEYLDRAVTSARAALAMNPPAGANVVPHFCLATKALMAADADPAEVLGAFIDAAGGENAPGSAFAAALMLSLEVHSRSEYITYRDRLLNDRLEDSSAWPVSAFLLDESCASSLFEPALPGEGANGYAVPARVFRADWMTSGGSQIGSSGDSKGVIHAFVFIEPTSDRAAAVLQQRVGDHLVHVSAARPLADLDVVGVFRGVDTNKVSSVMKQNRWSFKTVCLPEAEWQRCARDWGVFSADLRPNVFLVGPGGSTMLALSGVSPDAGNPDAVGMRIDVALRDHSLALAQDALAVKDYATYAARLATSFPLQNRRRSRYEPEGRATSIHGRQLVWAYMQAEDWQRALEAANANIAVQQGKPDPRNKAEWCRTCHDYLYATFLRIVLLRKMGAQKEADEVLDLVDIPKCPHGKNTDALWAEVQAYMASRPENPRFGYLRDTKRFLAEHETNMRSGRQNLYGFGVESDLMMRAKIYEKLRDHDAANADRRNAAVRAWPFKVREYDPDLLHAESVERRKLARRHLEAGEWKQVLELTNRNIEVHESEGRRCNSMCKICWAQVQSYGFRAETLEDLGRAQEAEDCRAMAELCRCPPGKELESYPCFPVNRMYGAGSGINRLNYILGVMKGENAYANREHRIYRLELAGDLVMRAQALLQLGEKAKAETDRKRAAALAYPLGAKAAAFVDTDEGPARYTDLLSVEDAEQLSVQ